MRQLQPYIARFKARGTGSIKEVDMNEIISRIPVDEFNDKPLSNLFLLGYSCQLTDLLNGNKTEDEKTEEE